MSRADLVSLGHSGPPSGSPLLTTDNLTYIGGFKFPTSVGGNGTNNSQGALAVRIVGGSPRFFTTLHTNNLDWVYEVNYPGLAMNPASFPTASLYRFWGDIYQVTRCSIPDNKPPDCSNSGNATYGLFWDEVDQRLYWSYGIGYGPDQGTSSLGYSTLDDSPGGGGTGVGSWRLLTPTGWGGKSYRGGILAVPVWFQDEHPSLNGRRLAAGFGGSYTIGQSGSFGPTLVAFNPADLATTTPVTGGGPTGGHVPASVLALFAGQVNDPAYNVSTRDNRYAQPTRPVAGEWQATDVLQGGAWIDIPPSGAGHPGVSGVFFSSILGYGNTRYLQAQLKADHKEYVSFITDPATLLQVVNGDIRFDAAYPTFEFYPTVHNGAGATFDPTSNRLYVITPFGGSTGSQPAVYVYAVTDAPVYTAPVFTVHPGNVTIDTAQDLRAQFAVICVGTPWPTFTWQTSHDSGATWVDFTGRDEGNVPTVNGPRMVYTPTNLSESGMKVRVVATNSVGSTISNVATITMTGLQPQPPTFVTQPPATLTVARGQPYTLTATTSARPAPLSWIWWWSRDGGLTWDDINYTTPSNPGPGPDDNTNHSNYVVTSADISTNGYRYLTAPWCPGFNARPVIVPDGVWCSDICIVTVT